MNNYKSMLKIRGIKQNDVVRRMRERGFHLFSRTYFYNHMRGYVPVPNLMVLLHLCSVIGVDIAEVMAEDYDFRDYKRTW